MVLFLNPYKNYFWIAREPWRTLYRTYFWATMLFIRIPIWYILSHIPWYRPRASWPVKRAVHVFFLQEKIPLIFNAALFKETERVDPQVHAKNEEEVGLVWIDAAPEVIRGELKKYAKINRVSVVQVPAYWFGARDPKTNLVGQPAGPDEKVIMNFHSGGFVLGDASPKTSMIVNEQLEHWPQFSRCLNVEYRLSQAAPFPMENPFPAACIDAVVAYDYLVNELGFKPSNIFVTGDSAGATLAFQFARYLATEKLENLPVPGALLLASASMDWGDSHKGPGASFWTLGYTDWIHAYNVGYCTKALLGRLPDEDAETNPWISPASKNLPKKEGVFTGFPPTLWQAGDAEMTKDAMITAYDRMVKDIGKDKVEFVWTPDGTHVLLSLPYHDEEREATYRAMTPFVNRYF